MNKVLVAGGVAGALVGFGVQRGLDVQPSQQAISRAETALGNIDDCQAGLLPMSVENIKTRDDNFAQIFRCGGNVVVMTVDGRDWTETTKLTQENADQNVWLPAVDEIAISGVITLLGAVGGVGAAAIGRAVGEDRRKRNRPKTVRLG